MGLYGSPYDYITYAALITTSRASLISTSFQPPLHGYHMLTHLSGFTAQAMHQLASYLPASLSDLLAQNVYISHRITSS